MKAEKLLPAAGFACFAAKELGDIFPKLRAKLPESIGAIEYALGIGAVAAGTLMQIKKLRSVPPCAVAAAFLGMQMYVLFGCFSGKDAYCENGKQSVYDKGPYALCRHPGLIAFAGAYASLCLGTDLPKRTAAVLTLLDLLLVVFEDVIVFPKTLSGYDEYKKTTPFLIPTAESIKRFFEK